MKETKIIFKPHCGIEGWYEVHIDFPNSKELRNYIEQIEGVEQVFTGDRYNFMVTIGKCFHHDPVLTNIKFSVLNFKSVSLGLPFDIPTDFLKSND